MGRPPATSVLLFVERARKSLASIGRSSTLGNLIVAFAELAIVLPDQNVYHIFVGEKVVRLGQNGNFFNNEDFIRFRSHRAGFVP
jgi:hypothetical protein